MTYTIGELSQKMGLTAHTLRFYEKEGLLQKVRKNSAGFRRYSDEDINRLRILECLKATGLSLKDIKHYFDLCAKGDDTIAERMAIFLKQKERLDVQLADLMQTKEKINFKIAYYEEAAKGGEKGLYERNPELAKAKKRLFPDF